MDDVGNGIKNIGIHNEGIGEFFCGYQTQHVSQIMKCDQEMKDRWE